MRALKSIRKRCWTNSRFFLRQISYSAHWRDSQLAPQFDPTTRLLLHQTPLQQVLPTLVHFGYKQNIFCLLYFQLNNAQPRCRDICTPLSGCIKICTFLATRYKNYFCFITLFQLLLQEASPLFFILVASTDKPCLLLLSQELLKCASKSCRFKWFQQAVSIGVSRK